MGLVVSFAGEIGSGKTSVSRRISDTLGWPRVGFGDYLRQELAKRGEDTSNRATLQDFGQSLVASDPDGFCCSVLSSVAFVPGNNLLLDGIRHVNIQSIIRRIVMPSETKLIFLAADPTERHNRILRRSSDHDDLHYTEAHPVEAELRTSLPAIADAIVDASLDIDAVAEICIDHIRKWDQSL